MLVRKAFMALNSILYDVEKY